MFRFDRTWRFPVPPDRLWAVLERTGDYPRWWPWLRRFDVHPPAVVPGTVAACAIAAPVVPFAVHFSVEVLDVRPAEHVDVAVRGDLAGGAHLALTPAEGDATDLRLCWALDFCHPLFGPAARAVQPLAQRGQDWVVATGVAQFRRRAFSAGPGRTPPRPRR